VCVIIQLQSGSCSFFDHVRRNFTRSNMDMRGMPLTWDLEDIISFGKQTKVSGCSVLT